LRTIKIAFHNILYFGKPTNIDHFFLKMHYIKKHFNFVLSNNPDFIISNRVIKPGRYKRIYYNPENVRPPIGRADWLFGPDYQSMIKNPKYFRQPNIVKLGVGSNLIEVKKSLDVEKTIRSKTKFCAFIFGHNVGIRNKFFDMLSKYKRVDSPGGCRNNMPFIGNYNNARASRFAHDFYTQKVNFIKPYKFVVAFENSSYPGYISEKLTDPMLVNSIPIYWGNPLIHKDFNPKSFIHPYGENLKENEILDYLMDLVIKIDKDDDLYAKYLLEPWYNDNKLPGFLDPAQIIDRYRKVFA